MTVHHDILVYGVVKPEIDAMEFAKVLIEIAHHWDKPEPPPNADGSHVEDRLAG